MHVNTESLVFMFLLLCTLPSRPVPLQYSLYPITAAFLAWSSSRCNTMETGRKYYLTSHSSHLPLLISSLSLRQRMCFGVVFFLNSRCSPVCECAASAVRPSNVKYQFSFDKTGNCLRLSSILNTLAVRTCSR